jgi:hypothetical protein
MKFPTLCDHAEYKSKHDLHFSLQRENRELERKINEWQPTKSGLGDAVDKLATGGDPGHIVVEEDGGERRQIYLRMIATGRAVEKTRQDLLRMESRVRRELIETHALQERHQELLSAVNRAAVDFGEAQALLDEFYDGLQEADLGCSLGHFGGYQISRPGRASDPNSQLTQWRKQVREAGYKI